MLFGWYGLIWAFCENFRLIWALHQEEVVFEFSPKPWFSMEVSDLRSLIFFEIREEGHYWRLHATSWSVILIFRTKCSLYKIWCHKVSNCSSILKKNPIFFWIYFYLSLLSWSQKFACILIFRVDTTQKSYAPLDFIIFLSSRATLMVIYFKID